MTRQLSADSPRRAAAHTFGAALARLLVKKNVGKRTLAREAGVTRSAIANYIAGLNLPTFQTAARIADILESDELRMIIAESRTYVCPIDRRRFTFNGQSRKTYCSVECQRVAAKQRIGTTVTRRADRAERRIRTYQAAVDSMCRECEPAGACRTADCPLRGVSPLPFVVDRAVEALA